MQNMRSELQNQVRKHAEELLLEFSEVTVDDHKDLKDHECRGSNATFRRLMGYNSQPTSTRPKYPVIPPILSPPDKGIFGTAAIEKVGYGSLCAMPSYSLSVSRHHSFWSCPAQ